MQEDDFNWGGGGGGGGSLYITISMTMKKCFNR